MTRRLIGCLKLVGYPVLLGYDDVIMLHALRRLTITRRPDLLLLRNLDLEPLAKVVLVAVVPNNAARTRQSLNFAGPTKTMTYLVLSHAWRNQMEVIFCQNLVSSSGAPAGIKIDEPCMTPCRTSRKFKAHARGRFCR